MRKLRSIQVLRAVAACAVVVLHAYLRSGETQPGPIRLGAAGVDLFFVISGFIMANVSVGRTPRQFLADRVWRIYPIWWIATIPWLFALPYAPQNLLASITLWPVYGLTYYYPVPMLGWTLGFEMLFYISMALAMATRAALPLTLFGAAFVLGLTTGVDLFAFVGNPLILEFLAGVWIARLPRDERFALPLLAVGLVAFAVAPEGFFTLDVAADPQAAAFRALFWGVPAAIVVYACLCLERRFASARWNGPVLLGDASYSIYLFHLTIINILPLLWLAEIAVSIAGGVVMWWFLERRVPEFRRDFRTWRMQRFRMDAAPS